MKLLKWLVKKETKIDKTNAVKSDNMTDVWAEADKWIPHGDLLVAGTSTMMEIRNGKVKARYIRHRT